MRADARIHTVVNRNARYEETLLMFVDQLSGNSFEEFQNDFILIRQVRNNILSTSVRKKNMF